MREIKMHSSQDCKGLKHPVSGERTGICWNSKALFLTSLNFLQIWDRHYGDNVTDSENKA